MKLCVRSDPRADTFEEQPHGRRERLIFFRDEHGRYAHGRFHGTECKIPLALQIDETVKAKDEACALFRKKGNVILNYSTRLIPDGIAS